MNQSWDELISAYLDGEATEDERAQVEGDPAALDELATFRRIQQANQDVPPASSELRSRQIGAALAAFDLPTPAATEPRAITDASPSEPTPTATIHRFPTWLAQAAAGVLLVGGLGIGAMALRSQNSDGETASVAFDESGDESSASGAMVSESAEDESAPPLAAGDDSGEDAAAAEVEAADSATESTEQDVETSDQDAGTAADDTSAATTTTQATSPDLPQFFPTTPFAVLEAELFDDTGDIDGDIAADPALTTVLLVCETELDRTDTPLRSARFRSGDSEAVLLRYASTPELVVIDVTTCVVRGEP